MKSNRKVYKTAQKWFDAVSEHFSKGSACEHALIQEDCLKDTSKWKFEQGLKCSRCGVSWGIPVRLFQRTVKLMGPIGSIRVKNEKEVVNE